MKVALSLFKYFPYSGLSRDFMRILREMVERGHTVTVFTSEWEGDQPDDIEINILRTYRRTNHARNAAFYRKLRTRLTLQSFDVTIGFNKMPGLDIYYGADYCYVGRVSPKYPILYRLTSRYRLMARFENAVFGNNATTQILSLSEREKLVYRQYYATADHRFHLLPPTLDKERRLHDDATVVRSRMRTELGATESDHLVLFVGSGFKTKGLDRAIDAIAQLPTSLRDKTRLLVIGQDDVRTFQRQARKRGISQQVQFMGGRSDIPELLAAGDLLLHPAYHENTGTVLLEAIASGLPVLATDVCGYANHIQKANAGLVIHSPFQQERLNSTLSCMLTSAHRYNWNQNGKEYGQQPALYNMPEEAVDTIERWVSEKQEVIANANLPYERNECFYLRDNLYREFPPPTNLQNVMQLDGETVREARGRRTIRFPLAGKHYYLKSHTGVGWQEIIKNLCYGRLPVIGATNEWHGVHWISRLGIDTLTIAGYGTSAGNPAHRQSFIITDEISDAVSLEDYFLEATNKQHQTPEDIHFKHQLIRKVAEVARKMHGSGANHRDFYLCHFLLPISHTHRDNPALHLIDLHRMQIRRRIPRRWVIKDISGLYYSTLNMNLSRRDGFRFMKHYRDLGLREILKQESNFWEQVDTKAKNLYQTEAHRATRLVDADSDSNDETDKGPPQDVATDAR